MVLGALAALYGALGLGQAIQNATNIAWSVPRNSRPNPILLRVKSLVLLLVGGVALLAVIVLSIVVSETEAAARRTSGRSCSGRVVVNTAVLTVFFRLATSRGHSLWSAAAGRGLRRGGVAAACNGWVPSTCSGSSTAPAR